VIRLRINARTVATLLGVRVAIEPERKSETEPAEAARPDWRSELARFEAAVEPTPSPYAELEEVLEARLAGVEAAGGAPTPEVGARCGSRPSGPQVDLRRRGQCPRTRR
jgi:hypothetical protein